ncbi:hypothetical protein COV24_01165 [candidate division WWE3 bacterium CG10_big_fil_rev_8_21_14_0_10_32_10]|uniref:Thioredoxin domain-containing protein n=1 Tax=candidate division WWE3 bacterium CG10_big_fil_rev_8_21_14_0_10_32_10 TaxID=1975090 RepID=A0A2H0RB86_UNCKA|nr:MAG: hypothetical protein COV24_01165 [candidate division WWE3 bacterium CG10_big_fil_rev_8_21_14_0_10_32_10]
MKIIKIGAKWCPGCIVMKPRWKEIEEKDTALKTVYYDFDENKKEIQEYVKKGSNLPVFIFIGEDGKELERLQGEVTAEILLGLIKKYKNK